MDVSRPNDELFTFIQLMPKVELHAHLNGSLSPQTLQKLVDLKRNKLTIEESKTFQVPKLIANNLSQCFEVFDLIHKITDSTEAIYLATQDVITDFYLDGVRYLELRTTPKEIDSVMTQDVYVQTVQKAIEDTCRQKCEGMIVKLLLSLDRKRPVLYAEETLKIAERCFKGSSSSVIGIDLSGNPNKGSIKDFIPLLQYAKKVGLKMAVHISEVPGAFEEIKQLLSLQPDRLGHGTYLHPLKGGSPENFKLLNSFQIPLEICLTSNVISKTVPSYNEHHFDLFKQMKYPLVLCTDDKGVFNTSLTDEYSLASKYFSLSKEDIFELSYTSINYIFADESVKSDLFKQWTTSKKL